MARALAVFAVSTGGAYRRGRPRLQEFLPGLQRRWQRLTCSANQGGHASGTLCGEPGGSEDNRFLRVGIDLGLEAPLSAKEGKGGEGEVPIAAIRDCILGVLSTWHSDALLAPEGKQKLKDELVLALHTRVPELAVKEVYFTDFLVQR